MPRFRILLIGAYGQFGRRIAEALAGEPDLHLLLAGRRRSEAEQLAARLRAGGASAKLTSAEVDVESPALVDVLSQQRPDLVIHTAGPFQRRDYRVAECTLRAGAHYVDLSDARGFVTGIERLDALARTCGRWAISGASSVPGISAAVVEALSPRFARLDSVMSAISPGNRTERGLATTRAILGYVGRPFPMLIDGHRRDVYGWQSLRRVEVPGGRSRWAAYCDVPDLDVLPRRYPGLVDCQFRAGLELRRMHFGLWAASWGVRSGMLPGLARWARPLLRISERWLDAGTDTGVMTVDLGGADQDGRPLRLRWCIVARDGSGPHIPATPAVVLARKLARELLPGGGARPCLDFFTLDECLEALSDRPISASVEPVPGTAAGTTTLDTD